MQLERIGVIGAGVMGTGVAQSLATAGLNVVVVDVSAQALARCQAQIRHNLRFAGMFAGRAKPDAAKPDAKPDAAKPGPSNAAALERIRFTERYDDLAEVDFVIENAVEKWSVKESVFRELDRVCRPSCVLASNTSAISITRSASLVRHPERVLGMHFMNPVPLIAAVEVIRGVHTSGETIAIAMALLERLGKHGIVVMDAPGFVSNRVLMLTVNEAIWVVHDGVSTPEDVDRIFRECMGHRMGPLATADLIGLDTILYSLEALQEQFGDPKFRPCPLLRRMVDAGRLGAKSGEGFYPH
jgi:3-hydroxybutyryl-CoA dehydrogenase